MVALTPQTSSSWVPLIKAGATKLVSPSEYSVQKQEIVKSSRNGRGDLFKYHLNWKYTISAVWYAVTKEQAMEIASATGSEGTILVNFYDPESDSVKSGHFYRGNDFKMSGVDHMVWQTTGTTARTPMGFAHYRVELSLIEY